MKNFFYIFFISMVPVIELRGAIPVGAALGMPWLECFLVSVVGNMVPVPFILLFIRQILAFMQTKQKLAPIANWVLDKADKHKDQVTRYATWGLLLFVAVPLPGTGAWTGALIAAVLNMRMKYALPSIFGGILLAGFIMSGAAYGFLGFLDFLL